MTREEFDSMSFDELLDYAFNELSSGDTNDRLFEAYELREFAKQLIDEYEYYGAKCILDGLDSDFEADYFLYDQDTGSWDVPTPVRDKNDLLDLFDDYFEESVNRRNRRSSRISESRRRRRNRRN